MSLFFQCQNGQKGQHESLFLVWVLIFIFGLMICAAGADYTWSYQYDVEGRVTEIQSPSGDIHYEYSQITGRKTVTWTGADAENPFNRIEYAYDPLGRLKEIRAIRCNGALLDPAYVTRYRYNKVGSVQTITYPNGIHSVYEYNALNRLTTLTHYVSSAPEAMILGRYEYMYYADGMRATAEETLWNSNTEQYDTREVQWKYDNLNRVTEEHLNGGYTLGFVYDLVGNCLRRTQDGVTTYFFYNERDELLAESLNADGSDPTTEYEYDANGSQTRKVDHVGGTDTVYDYNLQNRLRSVSENGQEIASYLYHPEGYRLGKMAGGTMVWYLSDPYNPTGYVQVLEEVSESGTTTYFHGLHVLGQMTDLDDPLYYLPDGQGSTRQTVQTPVTAPPPAPMTITQTMQQIHYDAYGKTLGMVPPGTNMLYRNQRYDPTIKMYDLRHREYDPTSMRFTQHDPWSGSIDDPMSLHRYLYCQANPINCWDPSGMNVSNWRYGQIVHDKIGYDFLSKQIALDPLYDRSINTILELEGKEKLKLFGLDRPDLVARTSTEVYEIKPLGSYLMGKAQLGWYLLLLNSYDPIHRVWKPGTSYTPPSTVVIDPLAYALVSPPLSGVIIYQVVDAKPSIAIISAYTAYRIFQAVSTAIQLGQLAPGY